MSDLLPGALPPLTFTGMLTLTGLSPVLAPLVLWQVQSVEFSPHPKDPAYLEFAYEGSLRPQALEPFLTTRLTPPIRRISGLFDALAAADFVAVRADYNLTPVDLGTPDPLTGSAAGLLQGLSFGYVTPAKFAVRCRLWRADRISQYGAALTGTPRIWTVS
jgi:hypothetical protein